MVHKTLSAFTAFCALPGVSGFAIAPVSTSAQTPFSSRPKSSFQMVDQNVIMGAGVAFAGLAVGIGLVAFTETQGERARARGGGLSEDMSTRLAGGLLEDVEVSSVSDVGSLASQLEAALKQTGATDDLALEMSEEEKQKKIEAADDGW